MNRFFSKLNLNDIKIKPDGNSFPPDADEHQEPETGIAPEVGNRIEEPAAETVDIESFETSDYAGEAEPADFTFTPEPVQAEYDAEAGIPVASNGHGNPELSYEESTALYASVAVEVEERVSEIVSDGIVIGIGEVLKVSARSRPSAVAGAIAGVVREVGRAEVQAIGAGATNQAIKAVAIARDYLLESGIDAVCVPAFIDVTIENEDRTAIRLVIEPR